MGISPGPPSPSTVGRLDGDCRDDKDPRTGAKVGAADGAVDGTLMEPIAIPCEGITTSRFPPPKITPPEPVSSTIADNAYSSSVAEALVLLVVAATFATKSNNEMTTRSFMVLCIF